MGSHQQSEGASPATQLQDAVCDRLTRDGALDTIRRKVIDSIRRDAGLEGRLQALIAERCAAADLDGWEARPRPARKRLVDGIKAHVLEQLRAESQAALWQLLAGGPGGGSSGGAGVGAGGGGGGGLASEAEARVLEALCALAEEEERRRADEVERARQEWRAKRREERRAAKAVAAQQQQQQHPHHPHHPQQQQFYGGQAYQAQPQQQQQHAHAR